MGKLPLYMLEQRAIQLLKFHEPEEGYYGCFSGGKDSIVIKHLTDRAKVKASWNMNNTTIDPPELIKFVRDYHASVILHHSKRSNLTVRMVEKGFFPLRSKRWCCDEYKEIAPPGRTLILGVRIAESPRRKNQIKQCFVKEWAPNKPAVLPIRLWSDEAVWEYIRKHKLPYCSLYDEGWKRLGCIGCPMQNEKKRNAEFARWPGYHRLWLRGFERLWEKRAGKPDRNGNEWFGSRKFKTWQELFQWWMKQ